MYSLLSAPVLGFDLVRLRGGAATAEILLRCLCLVEDDLPIIAAQLPDENVRAPLWVAVDEATERVNSLTKIGMDQPNAVALVERAPIGTADALVRCVRHEVLGWTWSGRDGTGEQTEAASRAASVICDAVVASYLRDNLSEVVRRQLAVGWVAAMRRLPATGPVDLGPHHYAVSGLLQRLGALGGEEVLRLERSAGDDRRHPGGWSNAVHSATWAAYLAGRVRTAAVAQLLLVQALDVDVLPLSARAGGVWNLLSGAVAALVVRDLLDQPTAHRLLAPAIAALGPSWLG
jgi:hypothetical protein